jgi:hypothetical protein
MRSIWETERTGKACVRASSALGSRGENILPPNLQDGCPSTENNPTASAHAFLELFPFLYDGRRDLALDADNGNKTNSSHRFLP